MAKFPTPYEASLVGRKAYGFTTENLPNQLPHVINVITGGTEVPDNGLVNNFDFELIPGIGGNVTYPPNASETEEGLTKFATEAEAIAGVVADEAITPATLKSVVETLSTEFRYDQTSPSATWIISHPLGRVPQVQVFIGNDIVITDVSATTTTITVTFSNSQTGYILAT